MRFDDIMKTLATDGVVEVAGGEVQIKRKLMALIGGVPIYSLFIDFPKERKEPMEFETLDKLDDYSLTSADCVLRRCLVCGDLPETGYYYDNEMKQVYCDYTCLVYWMNKVYGKGNWKVGTGNYEELKFYVEMDKDLVEEHSFDYNYIIEEGRYFREYDCVYIPPYEDKGTTVYNGLDEKIDQEIETLKENVESFSEQHDDIEEKLVENNYTPTED